MKKIFLLAILLCTLSLAAIAQDTIWTMEACMRYAVENSPVVKKQMHTNDTYKVEYASAIASFFPSLSTGVSARYSFGRDTDPATNTYVNTTTFRNDYEGYANLPVFNGGQLVNQFRLAKANRQVGMNDLQKAKDDLALNTLEAFVNVVYYQGTVRFAGEKLEESNKTLYKIQRQEELGIKGKADVAQIEAQVAGDDYNLTHQQNLYSTALLKLKEYMNYPYDEEMKVDTTSVVSDYIFTHESIEELYDLARETNPTALQAEFQVKTNKLQHLIKKGTLLPSISFSAGVATSYYDNLKSEDAPDSFKSQFKNNRGEYIVLNFSLPIFSRLTRVRDVRRARNNLRIAEEQQTEVLRQLQTAIEQSVLEREGYAKESIQMEKKLESDEIAYQVTLRKFEEGLMSPIDLQTSANTLIESKANLLKRQLMYLLKCKQVDYYNGKPLIVIND